MIRTAITAAVVALILSAATAAMSFQQEASVEVAIDLNTDGNSGTAVGAIDSCRSVNAGDSFAIDVVVKGVPAVAAGAPPTSAGMASFEFNLHYNPAVINVTAAQDNLMLSDASGFEFIEANYVQYGDSNPFPATSGDMSIAYAQVSTNYKSGDGVLSRLTIKAIGVGRSDLTLDDEVDVSPAPYVVRGDTKPYNVSPLLGATITVGQPCSSPPTPRIATPVPSGSPGTSGTGTGGPSTSGTPAAPTPVASRVPAGNTQLAIDAITTGNEATKVGQIDTCAKASNGETFQVDVVIKGVTNLLAWELPVSFDPKILRVDDRNVKLFQAANQGSSVFDTSNQTPNSTGIYVAGAVDTGEPPPHDSGDGVLVRLTFTAVGTGVSQLSLKAVDINGDNIPDKGVFLRNVDNAIIGDTDGDTFFDGPHPGAEIRVGTDCPSSGQVVPAQAGSSTTGSGSSNTWVWVVVAAAAVIVAGGAAGLLALRARRRRVSP